MQNKTIKPFDMKNLPLILDVVVPLWSPPVGSEEYKRLNVEFIVRNNIFDNGYSFELLDETEQTSLCHDTDSFCAAAFFARKGDKNNASEWFMENADRFPPELKKAARCSEAYIKLMDEKTLELMNNDDIKLSLFVSRKPGYGSLILDTLTEKITSEGWKNIFLWTDIECNWQWYNKHGFELIEEEIYEPFSSEKEAYRTFIYKKRLCR